MYMSRSVTTPTSFSPSTTGRKPQSASSMRAAAVARFVCGEQVVGVAVMMSLIFTMPPLRAECLAKERLRNRRAHGSPFVGNSMLVGGSSEAYYRVKETPMRLPVLVAAAGLLTVSFGGPAMAQQVTKETVPGISNLARLQTTIACA